MQPAQRMLVIEVDLEATVFGKIEFYISFLEL